MGCVSNERHRCIRYYILLNKNASQTWWNGRFCFKELVHTDWVPEPADTLYASLWMVDCYPLNNVLQREKHALNAERF